MQKLFSHPVYDIFLKQSNVRILSFIHAKVKLDPATAWVKLFLKKFMLKQLAKTLRHFRINLHSSLKAEDVLLL